MEQPLEDTGPPAGGGAARGRWELAALGGAAAALIALASVIHFLVDDAYITLRYARNWVEWGTPAFNAFELAPGGQPVEGFSNLLWTGLLALLMGAGAPFPDLLPSLQLSIAVAVLVVQLRFVATELRLGRPGSLASVLLLATSAPFVAWSTGGMETTLFTLLLTSLLVGLLRRGPDAGEGAAEGAGKGAAWLGVTAAALTAVRVEGVLWVAGVTGAVIAAEVLLSGEGAGALARLRRRLAAVAVLSVAAVAAQLLWRHGVYGEWLPNTVAAKTGGGAEVLARGLRQVGSWALVCLTPVAALALAPLALRHVDRRARVAAGASLLVAAGFAAYNVLVGGDWMPFFRFLAPCTPALALAAAVGLDALPVGLGGALVLGLAAAQPLPLFDVHLAPEGVRGTLRFRSFKGGYKSEAERVEVARQNEENFGLLGQALAVGTQPGDVLAFGPIGSPGWYAPDLDFVDRNGLVTPAVARREVEAGGTAGHEKRVPHAWFLDHGTPAPGLLYATWRPGAVREDRPAELAAAKQAFMGQGQTSRPEERPLFEGTRLRLLPIPLSSLPGGDPQARGFDDLTLFLFERTDPETARRFWSR